MLVIVTVTELPAAMSPRLHCRLFPAMGLVHEPAVGVAVCHTRPPLPGSASVSWTLWAMLPASPVLVTTTVKLTCEPDANVPAFGLLTTLSFGEGKEVISKAPAS